MIAQEEANRTYIKLARSCERRDRVCQCETLHPQIAALTAELGEVKAELEKEQSSFWSGY